MSSPEQQKAFMRQAIALSRQKMEENCGGPFGAVIVKNGKVIGEGWNKVTSSHDPTAHAEVTAIRNACQTVGDFSLKGCEIYTSCEPCPMCLAAIYWARLEKIYYANTRADAAAIGFDDDFLYREVVLPEAERSLPISRMLPEEAKAVFDSWMKKSDKTPY
jgi:guanine deaminase